MGSSEAMYPEISRQASYCPGLSLHSIFDVAALNSMDAGSVASGSIPAPWTAHYVTPKKDPEKGLFAMNDSRDIIRPLLQNTFICAGLLLFPALPIQAQDADDDTWFDQQLNSSGTSSEASGEASDGDAKFRKKTSPTAVFNALIKEYERTPEANLTKRIELLARATKTLPDQSSKAAATLESLQQQKREIITELERAATLSPIEQAIASLAPYRHNFSLDIALNQALLESAFATRIEDLASEAASRDDYESLQSMKDAIQSAGLSNLVLSRIGSLSTDSQNSAILRKWSAALEGQAPLKGERFLIQRALQADEARLGISIQIESKSNKQLAEPMKTSIARQMGDRFTPSSPDLADLLIAIDLSDITISEKVTETMKSSIVPGAIDERENPEFVALVAKYEKAAKLYESAMEAYELQFENWINNRQEGGAVDFQHMKAQAQSKMESIRVAANTAEPGSGSPGAAWAEHAAAQAELRAAEGLEQLSAPQNLPEPVKPAPLHLDILERIYATPSTIVVSKEETPYDYTSQKIDATFNCKGSLAIADASVSPTAKGQFVALSRKRTYTRNLDVNPRDPVVDPGDYSPEAIDSTKDLFLLEFASECAKKIDVLFAEASERYLSIGLESKDPQAVVLALSLKANDERFKLPEDEIRMLTELARNDAVSPNQLRRECLASVARTALASSPDKQSQAITLLRL